MRTPWILLLSLTLACGADGDTEPSEDGADTEDDPGTDTEEPEETDVVEETDETDTEDTDGPVLPACASTCDPAATPFGGGDGSPGAPYEICSAAQLGQMPTALSSEVLLCTDLDLTGWTAPTLGPFTGRFDGQGRTLSNLSMVRPGVERFALFDDVDGGEVGGFRLEDVDVLGTTGHAAVARVVQNNGRVHDVHVTGRVRGDGSFAAVARAISTGAVVEDVSFDGSFEVGSLGFGAPIVDLMRGELRRAVSAGTLASPGWKVGCIVQELSGPVSEVVCRMDLEGTNRVGGIAAVASPSGSITDSYFEGSVEGFEVVGGLVGEGQTNATRSYVAGAVRASGEPPDVFGLLSGSVVSDLVYDVDAVDGADDPLGYGTGLSVGEMQDPTNPAFSTWGAPWVHVAGDYPRLAWE